MKQTVNEAALDHQKYFPTCEDESVLGAFSNGMHCQSYKSFIAGAEYTVNLIEQYIQEQPYSGKAWDIMPLIHYLRGNKEVFMKHLENKLEEEKTRYIDSMNYKSTLAMQDIINKQR